ncbi:MAG TPA: class I SAM-dependent methyltransferase [Tepidisphaeraceae bacterium]|jgi:2-polyprenyl-3-methyl-5-hydroxy-6-metoxy-1,4-benzoquinol methylase
MIRRTMIDLTRVPCPVCGQTDNNQILHRTTYPEHHYPGTFTLYRCRGCGLIFNSPRLDLDELARLYGRNYYFFLRKDSREFSRIVSMYQRTVALIDNDGLVSHSARRSLDVGCGRGYFPAVLKRLGWDAAGVEISPEAAEYAKSKFGLDVFTGTIEQYRTSPSARQFPLVTAIDVIEHVPDPQAFIAAAAACVEPGGWLIIDTPNGAAQNITSQGVAWKGFNPFHIYLFSIDNLAGILSRHGMGVDRSFSYSNNSSSISLRDRAIHGLKAVGMLSPLVQLYFGLKKMTVGGGDSPEPHIEQAVSRIHREPKYTSTPDSTAPLAAGKTGDNIVVFARKL